MNGTLPGQVSSSDCLTEYDTMHLVRLTVHVAAIQTLLSPLKALITFFLTK